MPGFHPIRLIRKAMARAPPLIRHPDATDLKAVDVRDGGDPVVAEGALGQSLCVLEKPA